MTVYQIKNAQHLLAGSANLRVSGAGDNWQYSDTPGDGSDAY